jgi:hypothetical protein
MRTCFCSLVMIFFLYLFTPSALADVVELDNGSRVVGNIMKIVEGRLLIKTDFAGNLTIPMERVVSFSSDKPMFVAVPGEDRHYGGVIYNKGQTRISPPDSDAVIEKEGLVATWQVGMPDPLAPPPRRWINEAGLDLLGKNGNTERISTGGKIKANLSGPVDSVLFYLRWFYAEKNKEKTDDEITGGIDFETSLSKRLYWYSRLELERDDIEDLELRTTVAAGNAYYFLKEPDHVLRARAGLSYLHESFVNSDSETTIGIDSGFQYMNQTTKLGKLLTDITYNPSFEDFSDYLVYHETAFEMPLMKSNSWKFQLGVANKYTSKPVKENEKLDTIYFSRLVFRWGENPTDKPANPDFKAPTVLRTGLGLKVDEKSLP